jgi:hypothetical protein
MEQIPKGHQRLAAADGPGKVAPRDRCTSGEGWSAVSSEGIQHLKIEDVVLNQRRQFCFAGPLLYAGLEGVLHIIR